jgi:hypothetical protein
MRSLIVPIGPFTTEAQLDVMVKRFEAALHAGECWTRCGSFGVRCEGVSRAIGGAP